MGHVAAPFGVQGWIKVRTYTETIDSLCDYPVWWLGKGGVWREWRLLDSGMSGKNLTAKLEGCSACEMAENLQGSQVAVSSDALPPTENGEYYWRDLIGLKVVNAEGVELGRVSGLLETGANDVLVLEGERERLIPFAEQFILKVDLAAGEISVDWGADY